MLLTVAPRLGATVGREAMVGIAYVVATAATVLVVDGAPQGAEHVKRVLVGDLLSVSLDSLPRTALLYAAIGAALVVFHRKLRAPDRSLLLELGFYLCFAAVVTSSVAMAGVLVVFSLLIMPAVAGLLLARRFPVALAIAFFAGAVASVAGRRGCVHDRTGRLARRWCWRWPRPSCWRSCSAFCAVLRRYGLWRSPATPWRSHWP